MKKEKSFQIPKVIHYFWVGGAPKPESVIKCIESWKKNCPEFEIKEWNEFNYDIHKHPYMERAYSEKRWAFVTDFARLDILYRYGGIYMDTDVEVIKDLSPLCEFKAYKGFESLELVNDGHGFGCMPGLPIIKEMMACYDGEGPYERVDGELRYIESPRLCTKVLLKHGLVPDGTRQRVGDIEIFPSDFFCPLDYSTGRLKTTDNTYSIHHFDASWYGEKEKFYRKLRQFLNRFFGKKIGESIFKGTIHIKDSVKKAFRMEK